MRAKNKLWMIMKQWPDTDRHIATVWLFGQLLPVVARAPKERRPPHGAVLCQKQVALERIAQDKMNDAKLFLAPCSYRLLPVDV